MRLRHPILRALGCAVLALAATACSDADSPDSAADAGFDASDASGDAADGISDTGADVADTGADVTDAGEDATDTGEDATDTGEDATDAGEDATDAGEDATDAGEDATDAGEDATDTGEDVGEDAGPPVLALAVADAPDAADAGSTIDVTFAVTADGEPAPDVLVAVTIDGGDPATIDLTSGDDGHAVATVTLAETIGVTQISASVAESAPAVVDIARVAGPPAMIMAQSPALVEGVVSAATAAVTDAYGNPTADIDVTVTWAGPFDGEIDGAAEATVTTDADGLVTFDVQVTDVGDASTPWDGAVASLAAGEAEATLTTIVVTTADIDLDADLPPHFVIAEGGTEPVRITATADGVALSGLAVSLTVTGDGWTGGTARTDDTGVATVDMTASDTTAGESAYLVTASGVEGPSGLAFAFSPFVEAAPGVLRLVTRELDDDGWAEDWLYTNEYIEFSDGFERYEFYLSNPTTGEVRQPFARDEVDDYSGIDTWMPGTVLLVPSIVTDGVSEDRTFSMDLDTGELEELDFDGSVMDTRMVDGVFYYNLRLADGTHRNYRIVPDGDGVRTETSFEGTIRSQVIGACDGVLYWNTPSPYRVYARIGDVDTRLGDEGSGAAYVQIVHDEEGCVAVASANLEGGAVMLQLINEAGTLVQRELATAATIGSVVVAHDRSRLAYRAYGEGGGWFTVDLDDSDPIARRITGNLTSTYFSTTALAGAMSELLLVVRNYGRSAPDIFMLRLADGPDAPPERISLPLDPTATGRIPDNLAFSSDRRTLVFRQENMANIRGGYLIDLTSAAPAPTPLDPSGDDSPFTVEGTGFSGLGYVADDLLWVFGDAHDPEAAHLHVRPSGGAWTALASGEPGDRVSWSRGGETIAAIEHSDGFTLVDVAVALASE